MFLEGSIFDSRWKHLPNHIGFISKAGVFWSKAGVF